MENSMKKRFRFPWTKFLILGIFALLILSIYLIVVLNKTEVPARAPYDKTGFVQATDYIKNNGDTTIIENDKYLFELNNKNTTFKVLDKTTNLEWRSNPDTLSTRFLDTILVYYAGSLGAPTAMASQADAVKYQDYFIRMAANSIEILYELGGKKEIDQNDFPEVMTDERMQEVIFSKLIEDKDAANRVKMSFYSPTEVNGQKIWKLRDGIPRESFQTYLYPIFYETCGYTMEDLQYDLSLFDVVYEDIYPYVEVAIRYTLTENGFEVKLINDSIVEKEKFPLLHIDVLPYFGSGGVTDTGYVLVPDGSGVVIDFNNERSFALPYNQRIYGKDLAKSRDIMENKTEMVSLPLYGLKKNDAGFIAIAEEGAEMAIINAAISTFDSPYNRAYYRYIIRETEAFKFEAINSTTNIVEATKWYSTSDFNIDIRFTNEDEGSYSAMAKAYQSYLVEKGVLSKKDITNLVTLNLVLLGGYIVKDNFIGFPYEAVRSLTNTKEAEAMIKELLGDGFKDINLIYKGWNNSGLKPSYMGSINFDSRTGKLKDFKKLQEYLDEVGVNFFPEANITTAFTSSKINRNRDAIRDIFGKTVKNYDYIEPIFLSDLNSTEYYTLKSNTYEKTLQSLTKTLNKMNTTNLAFHDFGRQLYGSYAKKDNYFRTDTLHDFIRVMDQYQDKYNQLLFKNPSLYALKYTDVAIDIPTVGTDYQIVGTSVPFYQLVLSGYIDYSGNSFNLDDKRTIEWHKLKAIETLSNINFTWSYNTTTDLIDTEYSYYYSAYYKNWYAKALEIYQELNKLGIYNSYLLSHQNLNKDGSATKSVYSNGMEIVFNYGNSPLQYHSLQIAPNDYAVVKEAN